MPSPEHPSDDSDRSWLDIEDALRAWALRGATTTRARWGLNNASWFVDSATGRYVLRVYSQASPEDVANEHRLLRRLRDDALPFATPNPVVGPSGGTCEIIETARGPRVTALFERIEGQHIDDEDIAAVEAAGVAFARLDGALLSLSAGFDSWSARIDTVHPLVGDLSQLEELGGWCGDFLRRMNGAPSTLRASLRPRQLIHGDFAFGNILVRDGRIVGVLDFEFGALDARAAELATALRLVNSKGTRDLLWRPLLRGYLTTLPLSDEELSALPVLAAQHEAVVVAWWLGRYRSGLANRSSLDEHVERAHENDAWLSEHAAAIQGEAASLAASARRHR